MMSKLRVAVRVFNSYGLASIAYKLLVRMRIRVGQAWLKHRLIRRHSPYTQDPAKTIKCPHCRGRLEKAVEGLLCRTCGDVFI
jgi:hypothetical protein